jgi:peptidoglycan/xylan/chitin deacetylase (PgdA/CDA1 family)
MAGVAACSSPSAGSSAGTSAGGTVGGAARTTTGTTTGGDGTAGGASSPANGNPAATTGVPGATADTPGAAGPASTASPAAGPDLTRATSGRPEVALTFRGAGDVTILRRMLAEFADAKAHVTVLAIGTWLAADPQVARLVLDGGHDLGNHTWSHQTMPRLAPAAVRIEVDRAAAQLRTLTGSAGRWFRPSGTPHSTPAIRAAAVAAGYGACLGYDVDPLDYTDPGPDAIVRAFQAKVSAGSIVSLHLGHPETLTAMPRLLSTLADRGLSAVTTTHLLGSS